MGAGWELSIDIMLLLLLVAMGDTDAALWPRAAVSSAWHALC